jgi:hypothetical protein
MERQIFYEDLEINGEIPSLQKVWDNVGMVRWASVNSDFSPYHWDKDYAINEMNLPGAIVNGRAKAATFAQWLTNWIDARGTISKLSCQYRGIDLTGELMMFGGTITNKYVRDNKHYVECEIWIANPRGEKTTRGTAAVVLPSKS